MPPLAETFRFRGISTGDARVEPAILFVDTAAVDGNAKVEMCSPSIIAVIQVRMSSNRLPGKAMRLVGGRALLGHVLDRVRRCQSLDGLSIATSTHADDDPVVAFAEAEGVMVHRGALHDVAGRLLEAGHAAGAEAIVRISADSPLIDPEIVDHAVSLFRRERPDVVSNIVRRTFPKGQSVEVIRLATLTRVH